MRLTTECYNVWQCNYYEHIIRNEDGLNRSREYIVNNPKKWEFDRENSDVSILETSVAQSEGGIMNIQPENRPIKNEIILYSSPEGDKKVGVLYHDENFWLTQKAIAQLFNVEVPAISKHLGNIYDSGELEREATVSILETVRREARL